jgi:polyhydroxyalkanoate synthesis regulator phasin
MKNRNKIKLLVDCYDALHYNINNALRYLYLRRFIMDKAAEEEKDQTRSRFGLYELSRKVLLAGVGAAVLAQEELDRFVDRLVEHGELAEKDARKLVREVLDRREKMEKERQLERERIRASRVTKADVEAMTARINELQKQIEELKKGDKAD